ncbi:hypothetical protein [Salmonella phage SSBI34]|nr:hypothetical protein [Salmonella phage SSBI34]
MSNQRITFGVMAEMAIPVGGYENSEHIDLQEWLEEIESDLKLNYDGNMILFIKRDEESCDFSFESFNPHELIKEFNDELKRANVFAWDDTVKIFFDHWYDGCDSNHMQVTP